MSNWCHVVGCIYIDTNLKRKDIKDYVEKIIKKAPKITGSERDADIFVNVLSGYNTSTNCDCDNCIYKDSIVPLKVGLFQCDAEDDYDCPRAEYQTCLSLTIVGDLRDRKYLEVMYDLNNFIKYIKSQNFDIYYKSIDIYDEDCKVPIKYDESHLNNNRNLICKFIGEDGSLGLEYGEYYRVTIRNSSENEILANIYAMSEKSDIKIVTCPYRSIRTFLQNWRIYASLDN